MRWSTAEMYCIVHLLDLAILVDTSVRSEMTRNMTNQSSSPSAGWWVVGGRCSFDNLSITDIIVTHTSQEIIGPLGLLIHRVIRSRTSVESH